MLWHTLSTVSVDGLKERRRRDRRSIRQTGRDTDVCSAHIQRIHSVSLPVLMGDGMNGWTWESGGREGWHHSRVSVRPILSQPPCLLSPPSHTSPLLLRQQHRPACARHCLGSVVERRGLHVCVNMGRWRLQSGSSNHLFLFLLTFPPPSVILHLRLLFIPDVPVSSSISPSVMIYIFAAVLLQRRPYVITKRFFMLFYAGK